MKIVASNMVTALVAFLLAASGVATAENDHVVRSNPQRYRYRGSVTVKPEDVADMEKGVVVYLVHPESNAFQTVEPLRQSRGKVIAIPGNKFDKCFVAHLTKDDFASGNACVVFNEFLVTLYDIEIDFAKIPEFYPYDTDSELFKRYTGATDAPFINPNHPEIRQIADKLVDKSSDFLDYARLAFLWAKHNRLKRPGAGGFSVCDPSIRGGGLTSRDGVFVSLLRRAGIPARVGIGRGTDRAIRMWSEFYLEGYGWIPADPEAETTIFQDLFEFFGTMSLPNRIGDRTLSVIVNHVFGDNALPVPTPGENPVLYNTFAYGITWGMTTRPSFKLDLEPQ